MTSYKYYKYDIKYNQPEYWLKNKERYEKQYNDKIKPRLHEIQKWLDDGEPINEIIKMLHTSNHTLSIYRYLYPTEFGKMFDEAKFKRKVLEQKVKKKYKYAPKTKETETLCWRCNNIVPNPRKNKGCEWSVEDKPVPGWDATETHIAVYGRNVVSYCVHRCPKFKRLERGEQ